MSPVAHNFLCFIFFPNISAVPLSQECPWAQGPVLAHCESRSAILLTWEWLLPSPV